MWMKSYGVTVQMKAAEHYFPVVLFIMLKKGAPGFSLWMESWAVNMQVQKTTGSFLDSFFLNEILSSKLI